MSNKVRIQRTVFTNYPENKLSYGFRIFDDHEQDYCNAMAKEILDLSDKDFLAEIKALSKSDIVAELIDLAYAQHGIWINDKYMMLDPGDWLD